MTRRPSKKRHLNCLCYSERTSFQQEVKIEHNSEVKETIMTARNCTAGKHGSTSGRGFYLLSSTLDSSFLNVCASTTWLYPIISESAPCRN